MKKLLTLLIILTALKSNADSWTKKADAPSNYLRAPCAFSVGTKGYVLSGLDSLNNFSKEFWEYDQSLNVWTQKADFAGGARANPTALTIQGKGYVGFGTDSIYNNDWWLYNQSTNTWIQKANFIGGVRVAPTVFSIDDKGYICFGEPPAPAHMYNDLWEYNTITDIWTQKTSCPTQGRCEGIGFAINGRGYIGGGWFDGVYQVYHDLWEYNPTTDQWTQKANLPVYQFMDAGAFSIGSYGYVYGGEIYSPYGTQARYSTLWQYNPALNHWIQKATCPGIGRDEMAAFAIGNLGYVGWGGEDGGPPSMPHDFWEYIPDSSEMDAGIQTLNLKLATTVYPNPLKSIATISFGKQLKNAEIKIFDILGKEIKMYNNINENNFSLNSIDFRKGIYFYQVIENGNIIAKSKFEVQ